MNAGACPLEGPSLLVDPWLEALALQQGGCSSASEAGSDDRNAGFTLHRRLALMNAEGSSCLRRFRNRSNPPPTAVAVVSSSATPKDPFRAIRTSMPASSDPELTSFDRTVSSRVYEPWVRAAGCRRLVESDHLSFRCSSELSLRLWEKES
jgi:hypothetical protein